MAVYVLVEFDDNAQAKRFVEKVNGHWGAVAGDYMSRRVRAIWYKPTKFCDCTRGVKGSNPFYRSEKTGWWVHHPCGKPTRMWARGNHWFSAIGRNILPGNDDWTPKAWGPDGATEWGLDDSIWGDQNGHVVPLGEGQVPRVVTGERVKKRRKKIRDRPRRV